MTNSDTMAYPRCESCKGWGLCDGNPYPQDCPICEGRGYLIRDKQGRFIARKASA